MSQKCGKTKEKRGIIMQYRVRKDITSSNTFTDKINNQWPYITPKEYQKFSKDEKRICGDLRGKDSGSLDRILVCKDESEEAYQIGLYEYKGKKRWYEKTAGYVPAEYGREGRPCFVRVLTLSPFKAILLPLLILIFLAGIVLGTMWYLNREPGPNLDDTAVAYKFEGLVNTDPTSTMIPMIDNIEVYGGPHVEQALINPEGNTCYFIYSITLDDTGEEIYRSDLIEPGKAIVGFDLTDTPAAGSYNVTINVEARDIDDYEQEVNGGQIQAVMTIYE